MSIKPEFQSGISPFMIARCAAPARLERAEQMVHRGSHVGVVSSPDGPRPPRTVQRAVPTRFGGKVGPAHASQGEGVREMVAFTPSLPRNGGEGGERRRLEASWVRKAARFVRRVKDSKFNFQRAVSPFMGDRVKHPFIWGLLLFLIAGRVDRAETQPPPPTATNLWVVTFPGYQNSSSSTPAVAPEGTVYVGTFLGDFMAYTPGGGFKWTFKAGREIKSSPAIADDGTVYFGSRDRNFYALTPGGALKWKFATGAWVDSSPAIASNGTVYFGGWDGFFYALNPDGSLKWKLKIGAIVDSSPAIAWDGTVYFGAHDKNLYALNPDGTVRWKFATGGVIVSSPALGAAGTLYVTSMDGNLYAVNPDGSERWRYHSGSTTESSPVVGASGKIGLGMNTLFAVISPDGKKLWHAGSALPVEVAAAALPDRFYACLAWRTVRAMAADDAGFWSADLSSNVSASPTLTPSGILYVCAGFQLYAIRPPVELGSPTQSPWPMFRANPRHTGCAGLSQ